jgi:hypothetical protein
MHQPCLNKKDFDESNFRVFGVGPRQLADILNELVMTVAFFSP